MRQLLGVRRLDPSQAVTGVAPVTPAPNTKFPSAEVAAKDAPVPTMPPALSNTITVNLNQLMESGDPVNNIILQAGDIVTVPHAGIVYVLGAVGKPGGFVLANDRAQMTTLKMLALAGGLNQTAKSNHAVIIRRDRQGQQHEQTVDLKRVYSARRRTSVWKPVIFCMCRIARPKKLFTKQVRLPSASEPASRFTGSLTDDRSSKTARLRTAPMGHRIDA